MAGQPPAAEFQQAMDELMEMLCAWVKPRATYVVTRLGVIDALMPMGSKKSLAQLTEECKAPEPTLYRVLRVAGQVGILQEDEDHQYSATFKGSFLASDHPTGMRNMVMTWNLPIHSRSLVHLYEATRDNRPGCKYAYGDDAQVFDLFNKDPFELETFEGAMTATTTVSMAAAMAYDWTQHKKVVDVGGCQGTLVSNLVKATPGLVGINFDQPQVISTLPPVAGELAGRLTHVPGDMFKPFPTEVQGADAFVMKFILHDWSDAHCITILKNCAAALAPGGKVIVVDMIVPETAGKPAGTYPLFPFAVDMVMLGLTDGGCERTITQWNKLFEEAGMAPPKVLYDQRMALMVTEPL